MSRAAFLFGLVLLFVVAAWGFTFELGASPLLDDPNEGQYAEVAREMVETGDWLSPQLNYVLFLNKPPLSYWTIALAYRAFGVNEFAARLPSALAALVTVLLVVWLGVVLFDRTTGLLGGFLLFAMAGFFVESHEVRPDLLLTASLTGSLLALAYLVRAPSADRSTAALLGMQLCLAIGLLAKGMLALILPAVVLAVIAPAAQRGALVRSLLHPRAWWLFALLVLPWHVAMSLTHRGFVWDYVVNQHLLFFFDRKFPRDSTPISLGLFWMALALRLAPWTVFAPLAMVWAGGRLRDAEEQRRYRFLIAWCLAVLLLFSAAASRMEHYSLPALPAMALLLAALFVAYQRAQLGKLGKVLAAVAVAWAGLLSAASIVLLPLIRAQEWLQPNDVFVELGGQVFAVLALSAIVASLAALLARRAWVAVAIIVGFVAIVPYFVFGMRLMAPVNSSKPLADTITSLATAETRIIFEAPTEYQNCAGLNFYLRRRLDILGPPDFVPPTYLEAHVDRLFVDQAAVERLWRSGPALFVSDPLQERDSLASFMPTPIYLVHRDYARWLASNRAP